MPGLMQDWPLRVTRILDHAAKYHASRPILSRSVEGAITSSTWGAVHGRALKVAQALVRLGVRRGDMIGCMAWNTTRHIEIWYGVPGAGGILHSLNPRLSVEQLTYVIDHAEDQWIFVDHDIVPVLEKVAADLPKVNGYIVMTDRAHMPETSLPNALCYEDLLDAEDGAFSWIEGQRTIPAASASLPGPRAIPRALSTRTALTCCTRWSWFRRTCWACRLPTP